ncbi:MAG: hypothetical protein ABEJ99_05405 [Candidatus Nanohaloarchaea archaeon]
MVFHYHVAVEGIEMTGYEIEQLTSDQFVYSRPDEVAVSNDDSLEKILSYDTPDAMEYDEIM